MTTTGDSQWFGIAIRGDLKSTMTDVNVLNALSNALAVAREPSATVNGVMIRIHDGKRRAAVRDAIKAELANRQNQRIASGTAKVGERPCLPLPYLENSMKNARRHAVEMGVSAGVFSQNVSK